MSIKLRNLNISFSNKIILKDAQLLIHPYEITVLSGESGSGKTSLLNVIGLLDTQNTSTYEWDGKVIDKEMYHIFKREKISYVFQDYNMIDDLSVIDNFKIMFNVAGLKYSKKKVLDLLKIVSVEETKLKQKSKSLSGGEKQRIAIALALVKEPNLLLLDEPTANLDEENAIEIIKILHTLKKQGYMIVVASHHPNLYEADHFYEIKDANLIETKYTNQKEIKIKTNENSKRKKFNIFSYSYINITRHLIIYMLVLLAICISIPSVMEHTFYVFNGKSINDNIADTLSDKEIFIKNDEKLVLKETLGFYMREGELIEKNMLEKIRNMNHVESAYLYHKSDRNASPAYEDGDYADRSEVDMVSTDTKSIDSMSEFGDAIATVVGDKNTFINRCTKIDKDVENGVFITSELANALEIKELNHTKLTFNMGISMGCLEVESSVLTEDGQHSETIVVLEEHYALIPVTYEIKGIYEEAVSNIVAYDYLSGVSVYIDYQEYEKQQQKLLNDTNFMNSYKEWAESGLLLDDRKIYYGNYSSACIVTVDDYKYIDEVVSLVKSYGDHYSISTVDSINDKLDELERQNFISSLMQPIILYFIAVLLITLFFIYLLKGRKKEFALMKANGIKQIHLSILMDQIYVCIASIPIILYIFYPFIKEQYLYVGTSTLETIEYYNTLFFKTGVIGIVLFIMILGICFIVEKIYFKNNDVIKELRSK